jgi:hypothetical protein
MFSACAAVELSPSARRVLAANTAISVYQLKLVSLKYIL